MSGDFIGQDKTVKVAKGHYCHGCGKWCEIGEEMRYQSGKQGGAFYSRYWCMDCYAHKVASPVIGAFCSIANDLKCAWNTMIETLRG
jgi:hypothetical protein